MALEIGSRLGHYDVTALIGEGGMREVYRDGLRSALVALILILGSVVGMHAQGAPTVEISGGYALLNQGDTDRVLPKGLYASGAWRLLPWFGVVGEVGWHRRAAI